MEERSLNPEGRKNTNRKLSFWDKQPISQAWLCFVPQFTFRHIISIPCCFPKATENRTGDPLSQSSPDIMKHIAPSSPDDTSNCWGKRRFSDWFNTTDLCHRETQTHFYHRNTSSVSIYFTLIYIYTGHNKKAITQQFSELLPNFKNNACNYKGEVETLY